MISQPSQTPFGRKTLQLPLSVTMPLGVVGWSEFGRYPKISSEQTYNMTVSDDALVPFYGYEKRKNITSGGEAREIFVSNRYNHMISVVNNGVYTISNDLSINRIGTLDTSTGSVYIAENNASEIAICDGLKIYIFNYNTNTFSTPVIDFLPVYISFQDTYFIAADGRTNQWRLSDNNNGLSWPPDASHVGLIQGNKATNAVAVIPLDKQLFTFGTNLGLAWSDVGATLFPYQQNNSYSIPYGVINAQTLAADFGKLVWLGFSSSSGVSIMVSDGGQAQRISTDGMDYKLSQLEHPEDSFGFIYKIDGNIYYQITFREDNLTYAFSFTDGKFITLTDEKMDHHIAKRITFFNNRYYFISFKDGSLYELSSSIYTYDGKEIPRKRICKNMRLATGDNFIIDNVTLTMEQGFSQFQTRQNIEQAIDISISKDGGYSYGNIERKSLMSLGNRPNIFNAWNLGMANDAVIKFSFWGFERFVVTGGVVSIHQ